MLFRQPEVSREGLKFYPWTFFLSLLFYQSTVLSSHTVDGHLMYFGGSVVCKASTDISSILPILFTGGQKVRNLVSFSTSLNFEPLAFANATRYPNSETNVQCCDDRPMFWPSFVKLGPRTPRKILSVVPSKIAREKVLYRQ